MQEAAIKKILGQDPARKKKEEKMNKHRDEIAKVLIQFTTNLLPILFQL